MLALFYFFYVTGLSFLNKRATCEEKGEKRERGGGRERKSRFQQTEIQRERERAAERGGKR